MHLARALRLLGYVLFVISGLSMFVDVASGMNISGRIVAWFCAYGVFGVAFHVGASADLERRKTRLAALAVQIPAVMTMAALVPCNFGALSVVIVSSQAALVLAPWQSALQIAVQTGALALFLVPGCSMGETIPAMIGLLGFQSFAAVAVFAGRREAEARRELARTNAELRATRSLLEETSRANERTRISRELHDVLGHDLTALGLQLEIATHVPEPEARAQISKAQEVSARLLKNVRQVVTETRTPSGLDVAAALRALVEDLPDLTVHLSLPERLVVEDGARAHCVLRCVQEIVTNTMRHARAKNLYVCVEEKHGTISVEAKDDGAGAVKVCAGHGLSGMRARVEEMGGDLMIGAAPERPFEVFVRLPLREAAS
jgi:signal transduction histidine kinase